MKKSIIAILIVLCVIGLPMAAQSSRQIGKTIMIGDMSMKAFGQNPGIGFNFGQCYRDGQYVVLTFQFPNIGQSDIENIWIRNYDNDATTVTGPDGQNYPILVSWGTTSPNDGNSVNIPKGGFRNGYLVIMNVPANVDHFRKVVFNATGQFPMDANLYRYEFVLENVAIAAGPQNSQADKQSHSNSGTTDANYSKPAGGWLLTAEGVGPLKLGGTVSSLPNKVDGLYDSYRVDGNSLYFDLNGDSNTWASIQGGKIVGLSIGNQAVGLKVGNKKFKVNDDADALKAQPGVKGESYNDDGEYNGVKFSGHDGEIMNFTIGRI